MVGAAGFEPTTCSTQSSYFSGHNLPSDDTLAELKQLSAIELELSDLELENVVGGDTAKTFQANANRFDPYKSFNFR
jgi:hypothetical protein